MSRMLHSIWPTLIAAVILKSAFCLTRFPILYVYTIVPDSCFRGFPEYIKFTIEQALLLQPDCDIILASNYAECAAIEKVVDSIKGVIKFDTTGTESLRSKSFANASLEMFAGNANGDLWMTSASRFFTIEDFMISRGYAELLHFEADNMIYGKITDILPELRSGYKALAATPLNAQLSFITASAFWIPNLASIRKFNDFLLGLGQNQNQEWDGYLKWLRPFACCKHGGVDSDKHGNGIKPFAINEMSMLAYYAHKYKDDFSYFPVVPSYDYQLSRYVCNMSSFGPNGDKVGPPTGQGVWDSGSWGQYIGGTALRHGRDIRFTDSSHIAGQAIRTNDCTVKMVCSNVSYAYPYSVQTSQILNLKEGRANSTVVTETANSSYCYTAPHVRCEKSTSWTPLWNLHINGKRTHLFSSQRCDCLATAVST